MADETKKDRDFAYALVIISTAIDCLDRPEQFRMLRALQSKYEPLPIPHPMEMNTAGQ